MNARIKHWLHGLGAAFIGGGASAVSAQTGLALGQTVGLDVHPLNLKALGVVFVSSGIFTAAAYLKQSPLPQEATGDTVFITKPQTIEPPKE